MPPQSDNTLSLLSKKKKNTSRTFSVLLLDDAFAVAWFIAIAQYLLLSGSRLPHKDQQSENLEVFQEIVQSLYSSSLSISRLLIGTNKIPTLCE